MTKTCPKCGDEDATFYRNKRSLDGLAWACKQCSSVAANAWVADNRERKREHHRRAKERNKYRHLGWVLDELRDVPCADCRHRFPVECMDFDHLGDKNFNLSSWQNNHIRHLAEMMVEVAKCEVVCSNCHRIRSRKRLQGQPLSASTCIA